VFGVVRASGALSSSSISEGKTVGMLGATTSGMEKCPSSSLAAGAGVTLLAAVSLIDCFAGSILRKADALLTLNSMGGEGWKREELKRRSSGR
jgi:hypothetical protein